MIGSRSKAKLAVLLFSTALAPFVAEGAFSLVPILRTALQTQPEGVDRRTRRELITELRGRGVDAFPTIQPALLLERMADRSLKSVITVDGTEVLPFGGIADKETVLCNETGQYVLYHSDEHGFHNPKGIWSRARLDIAAVGDSLTHGACVSSEKSAVALIRHRYPATLNLGMSHNGPLFLLAAMREYLPSLRPAAVIWFHSESDFMDLAFERRSPVLRRYFDDETATQRLREQQPAVDRELAEYVLERLNPPPDLRRRDGRLGLERSIAGAPQAEFSLSRVLKLTETRRLARTIATRPSSEAISPEEWSLFSEILERANRTVRSWNGRLYFVYLPSYGRYQTFGPAKDTYDRVVSIVEGLNIPVIDVARTFDEQESPKSLFNRPRRDAHFTEEGYKIVADRVLLNLAQTFQTSAER
jgi:hypothetical protein